MGGMRDLDGKHVVITGANSGIGLSLLEQMIGCGCRIVAADIDYSNLHGFDPSIVHPVVVDLSVQDGVDLLFREAVSFFGTIDIFVANAGFPYYEMIRHGDWDHIHRIFAINTISPIYSYEMMISHLEGREGIIVITDSAMGETAMPGFSLYSSTKFALDGFRSGIMFERPGNLTPIFIYPVSTDTGFFRQESTYGMQKPFPVQTSAVVAKSIIKGIRRGRRRVYPSRLYLVARILFIVCPPMRWGYRKIYQIKMRRHLSVKD